jgi:hypothetical protein
MARDGRRPRHRCQGNVGRRFVGHLRLGRLRANVRWDHVRRVAHRIYFRECAGAQLRVHTDPAANTDVCVTLANSGREPVTLTLTGDTTPSIVVNPGDVRAQCVDGVQFVDVICSGQNSCSAQWRVDLN